MHCCMTKMLNRETKELSMFSLILMENNGKWFLEVVL